MIKLEIPYREVKGNRIHFEWNGIVLMAWVFILDKDDNMVKGWEFQFEEN